MQEGQKGLLFELFFEKKIKKEQSIREQIVEANRQFTIIWSVVLLLLHQSII